MGNSISKYYQLNQPFFRSFDSIVLYIVDPGAYKVLSALNTFLKKENHQPFVITEGWARESIIEQERLDRFINWDELERFAATKNILLIYGAQNNFKRNYEVIDLCQSLSISTLFVFDSWKNYRINFYDSNTGRLYLPDRIAAIDEYCKQSFIDELRDYIPEDYNEHVDITGHLAIEESSLYINSIKNAQFNKLKLLYNPENKILNLFIMEPIRKDFFETNRLNPGYDEYTILQYYFNNIHKEDERVLIKLHPRQNKEDVYLFFTDNLKYEKYDYHIVGNEKIEHLLAIADKIYGMTSIALNTAIQAGRNVMSLQIGRTEYGKTLSNPALEEYVIE